MPETAIDDGKAKTPIDRRKLLDVDFNSSEKEFDFLTQDVCLDLPQVDFVLIDRFLHTALVGFEKGLAGIGRVTLEKTVNKPCVETLFVVLLQFVAVLAEAVHWVPFEERRFQFIQRSSHQSARAARRELLQGVESPRPYDL